MTEPITAFGALRAGPQIMMRGKPSPIVVDSTIGVEDVSVRPSEVSVEERRILERLKLRDKSVRDEEETHARMLGRHAGAIRYEYQIGPDGRVYVIDGSVEVAPKFNSSDPEEIRKVLQTIQRAAISVSIPSRADLDVAAQAANKAAWVDQKRLLSSYSKGTESAPAEEAGGLNLLTQLNVQA